MLQRAHEFIFKVTRCRRLPLTFREADLSGVDYEEQRNSSCPFLTGPFASLGKRVGFLVDDK